MFVRKAQGEANSWWRGWAVSTFFSRRIIPSELPFLGTQWAYSGQWGAAVLVVDRTRSKKLSKSIRLYELLTFDPVFQEELHLGMHYVEANQNFHTFEIEVLCVFCLLGGTDCLRYLGSVCVWGGGTKCVLGWGIDCVYLCGTDCIYLGTASASGTAGSASTPYCFYLGAPPCLPWGLCLPRAPLNLLRRTDCIYLPRDPRLYPPRTPTVSTVPRGTTGSARWNCICLAGTVSASMRDCLSGHRL